MDSNLIVQKTDNFVVATVDGEQVIMQIENGYFFALNETAEDIWNAISGDDSVENIISSVAKTYKIETSDCASDIEEFIQDLADNNLVSFA